MSKPELVIAMYRPKAGKEKQLNELVTKHFPTLKEYGLTSGRDPYLGKSEDGTVLEIFEWKDVLSSKKAHDHPAVAKIWEAMAMVCDFGRLDQLPEAKNMFPHFAPFGS